MSDRDKKDYTISLETGIEMYEQASTNALERISDLGVDIILEDRPKTREGEYFDGRLPANISSFGMSELGELYGLMDRYANWISGYVCVAYAEVKNKSERLELVKARVRKSKIGNKDDKADETLCDSRYQESNCDWIEAFEYHHLLENVEKAARRNLSTISRLVETKKVEYEQGRVGGNMGKRGQDFGGRGRPHRRTGD